MIIEEGKNTDEYGTRVGYTGGYEQALDDIIDVMDSCSDIQEMVYQIRRFIVKHKTGTDIAELVKW